MTKKKISLNDKINIINNEDFTININNFFKLDNNNINIPCNININTDFFKNLDIFTNNNVNKSIFKSINYTYTLFGQEMLNNLILNPIDNIDILQNRQYTINKIILNNNIYNDITEILLSLKNEEKKVLWFWNQNTEHIDSIHDIIFFNNKYLKFLNNYTSLLNVSNIYKIYIAPFTTIFSPILTIIIPFIILKIYKINMPFKVVYNIVKSSLLGNSSLFFQNSKYKYIYPIISSLIYIQNIYYSIILSININNIINTLHIKLNTINKIINSYEKLFLIADKYKLQFIETDIINTIYIKYTNIKNIFNFDIFKLKPSIFENKGLIISTYYNFIKYKNDIIILLKYIGIIDAYISTSILYKNNNYCFTTYKISDKPIIIFNDIKHPYLNNCISNNIKLCDKNLGMIITGPNAAGKSTYIKSLTISILLSQSLTISCSTSAILSPFYNISTYLNIPDCQGKESLFEAEMFRCKEYLDFLKNNPNKLSFIIIDEILSSTNYIEGYSAAFSILKKISSYNNNSTIVTTHYNKLSKLEKNTNKYFKNYKFYVKFDKNNNIIFSYKIKRGISKQYIALKLLKQNNFDEDIINLSYIIINKIKHKY